MEYSKRGVSEGGKGGGAQNTCGDATRSVHLHVNSKGVFTHVTSGYLTLAGSVVD